MNAENEVDALKKELQKARKTSDAIIAELRVFGNDNILLKGRVEALTNEKAQGEKKVQRFQEECEAQNRRLQELENKLQDKEKEQRSLQQKLEEVSRRVLSPETTQYVYQVKMKSLLGTDSMIMILRTRMSGEIIMQFENKMNEQFTVRFKDVKSIEKGVKNPNTIRIVPKSLFSTTVEFDVAERQRVMEDIKKFWKFFLSNPERNYDLEKDTIDKIKEIFFSE